MKYKLLLLFVFSLLLSGCAAKVTCPKNPAIGSLGGLFNSDNDEYSPFFYNNTLYFTSTSKEKNRAETIIKSEFENGRFSRPQIDSTLPLAGYANAGLPTFFDNPLTEHTELYFAAISKKGKINRNIFFAEKIGGRWTRPKELEVINSPAYESHPFISSDGTQLFFSSDREGSVGGIDLFTSIRQADGSWGSPQNLVNINTPENEITPYLAADASLYFASQGYSDKKDYNIMRASPDKTTGWANPKLLPFPINSDDDDTGPAIFKDRIFIASNRRGGCGGIDLYAFQACGPVQLECVVVSKVPDFPLSGTANLYNSMNEIINSKKVDEKGFFKFELVSSENYKIEYINDCQANFRETKDFFAPCSDSNVVVIKTMFEFVPKNDYDLTEVKVPFFVSGYYMPNTRENLEALRLKFAYNLIGLDEGTQYIEKPGDEYDSYVDEVEVALKDAAERLYSIVTGFQGNCLKKESGKIQISIAGFADPRPISPKAYYPDANISDPKLNFYLERGTAMDNLLLSKLRAYYTAKYFENFINSKEKTGELAAKLIWKIDGRGVDSTSTMPSEMLRRVNIKIKPMP